MRIFLIEAVYITLIISIIGAADPVPMLIDYQGELLVAGSPFDGTGQFLFAVMDEDGVTQYWSSDGEEPPSEPLELEVNNGLFSTVLGNPEIMAPFADDLFEKDPLYLRIWFDDGSNGMQRLEPDRRFVSNGFAIRAGDALKLNGHDLSYILDWDNMNNLPQGFADGDDDDQPDNDAEVPDFITIDNLSLYAPMGAGNVGIGTDVPDRQLEVRNAQAYTRLTSTTSESGSVLEFKNSASGFNKTIGRINFLDSANTILGSIKYSSSLMGTSGISFLTNDSTRMKIASSGNIGIGVPNPDAKLDVEGKIQSSEGFKTDSPPSHGVDIQYAGYHGLNIEHAAQDGINILYTEHDGIYAAGVSGNGVTLLADDDGCYAVTYDLNHEWGVYTPDKISSAGGYAGMKTSGYAQNIGAETLHPGDIVSIAGGYEENVLGCDGIPVIHIVTASEQNSNAVFGVVDYRTEIQKTDEDDDAPRGFRHAGTSVNPGDYLSVTVFGPVDVRINAKSSIRAGQKLTVAGKKGFARAIQSTDDIWSTGVLGKALEDSDGSGWMKIFVNCR